MKMGRKIEKWRANGNVRLPKIIVYFECKHRDAQTHTFPPIAFASDSSSLFCFLVSTLLFSLNLKSLCIISVVFRLEMPTKPQQAAVQIRNGASDKTQREFETEVIILNQCRKVNRILIRKNLNFVS